MYDDLIRESISYCPETGEFHWKVRRGRIKAGSRAGKTTLAGYRMLCLAGKNFLLHRVAWLLTYGSWPTLNIDHINRIRDDNRIVNLRDVTQSQNCRNRPNRTTTGFMGVTRHKQTGKWQAQVCYPHQPTKYLGLFESPELAAEAYRRASI